MAGELDLFMLEKQIGGVFSKRVQRNLRVSIKDLTNKISGTALKSNARAVYKNGLLHSIEMKTPYYIYPILNFGFEGSKKSGISKRVPGRDILKRVLEDGKLLEDLADFVGNTRADAITRMIQFVGSNGSVEDKELQISNTLTKS